MRTCIKLENTNRFELPLEFQEDDVRYSESIVEHFLNEFTGKGDIVFDPFAGYGTTLIVAEAMGRIPLGIEYDEKRVAYIQSKTEATRQDYSRRFSPIEILFLASLQFLNDLSAIHE